MIAHVRRLARGEAITHGSRNGFLNDGMARRPAVLVHLIFGLLGVLGVESDLKPSNRGLTWDFCQEIQRLIDAEMGSRARGPAAQEKGIE